MVVFISKMKGKTHHNWKGGRNKSSEGYITCWVMDDKFSIHWNGYMLEHRYIMEKKLGRKLTKNESIHHIDFDKTNNSEENLLLCKTRSENTSMGNTMNLLVKGLLKDKIIVFDRKKKKYVRLYQ